MHVGIVMGSDSDLPVMKKAFSILDDFGVTYDVTIASAHRTPKKLADFVAEEEKKGVGAFIAGAGMASSPSRRSSQPDAEAGYRGSPFRCEAGWHGCPVFYRADAFRYSGGYGSH